MPFLALRICASALAGLSRTISHLELALAL